MILGIARASDLGPADDFDEMAWDAAMDTITEDDTAVENVAATLAEEHPDLIARLTQTYLTPVHRDQDLAEMQRVSAPLWEREARAKIDRNREM